jgi:hypothetical protein
VIWQSIAHRWDKPGEWRQLLDAAKETIDRGIQSYPLCNARLFNNRLTMKNAQVFDDLPTWKTILFLPLEARIAAIKDPETRKKMRYEAVEDKKSSRFSRRWDLVYLINAVKPENKYLEKKSVAEIKTSSTHFWICPSKKDWTPSSRLRAPTATKKPWRKSSAVRTYWSANRMPART